MTKSELKILAKNVVASLSIEEMTEYATTLDQWLFAHYLCEHQDIHGNDANTDVFEIALDDRALALGLT